VCCFIVLLAACEKKATSGNGTVPPGSNGSASVGPVDTTPLTGIDLAKLDDDKQQVFYRLMGSLNSPCGKSENLRKSFTSDVACKRAPFAVRFVVEMLADEANEDAIRKIYGEMYAKRAPAVLDYAKAPRFGPNDAGVRLAEFFDYACSHCVEFKPVLDEVLQQYEGKVVMYYFMYPVPVSPHSRGAAQAALAAHAQDKFKEMHAMLFAKSPEHTKDAVKLYAAGIGLDLAKFETDYEAAGARVDADHEMGKKAGVKGTPGLFINEQLYEGPQIPKYINMWIDQEMAVNR
jgi:protein-disulfide isomerase